MTNKYFLIILLISLSFGCTSRKIINGKEQNFVEYVILNKNATKNNTYSENMWKTNPEMFPGLRLIKWINCK